MLYITKEEHGVEYNVLWFGKPNGSPWYSVYKIVEINQFGTNGWDINSRYFKENLVCKL